MRKNISKVRDKFNNQLRVFLTSMRKLQNRSDYKTWGDKNSLSKDWDGRTGKIATLIEEGSSVIEFGAGRLVLQKNLPMGCTYTPSDIVDRGQGTIVCDLNSKHLPEFQAYDVAVFSGVLEYVNNVPKLIFHLSSSVEMVVVSYAGADLSTHNRRAYGWVNDYSSKEIIKIFKDCGFCCIHTESWQNDQLIYKFTKSHNSK